MSSSTFVAAPTLKLILLHESLQHSSNLLTKWLFLDIGKQMAVTSSISGHTSEAHFENWTPVFKTAQTATIFLFGRERRKDRQWAKQGFLPEAAVKNKPEPTAMKWMPAESRHDSWISKTGGSTVTEKKNRTIHYSFKATPEEDAIIQKKMKTFGIRRSRSA